jgi:hypothetical protein
MVQTGPCQRVHSTWGAEREAHTEGAVLPVPYPNGLVVAGADNPGKLVVEEDGPDVVQMAVQGEETPAGLVGPDLDLVVVAAGDEEGLSRVSVLAGAR